MARNRRLSGRRAFLLGSGALVGMSAAAIAGRSRQVNNQTQALDNVEQEFAVAKDVPLRSRAEAKGLIYGAASEYRTLTSNPAFATFLAQESAMLVPTGELKWKALRPSPDRFDFKKGDWMAEFARTHGMLFRGHTLVWGKEEKLPRWFRDTVNRQNAEQVLRKHIATVAGHYAGKMHSWDVVNEAIKPRDGRSDGFRETPWLEFLGPEHIDISFRAAAEADPKALLVYNDNGLDSDSPQAEAKRTAVLKLLERLKSNGTPIHALGTQAHLGQSAIRSKFTGLRKFLDDVAGLGLKILITEMDVSDKSFPTDSIARDRMVAETYENYLSVVLDQPAVIAIVTWGLSDRYTWLSEQQPRTDGSPVRPLPFDADLRPKLASSAIARAFEKAPRREAQLVLPQQQTSFQDVKGHWAQVYIQALAAKNIISGFPDETFRPNAPVTRAEFASIIIKAFTPAQQDNNTIAFQDISQDFWGYDAIRAASQSGFLAGYPNGTFQPSQQIPRVQVLVSLASGLKLSSADTKALSFYQDAVQIPAYATNKVAAVTQREIVINYPTVRLLNPNRNATRAEVAAFVYQALVDAGMAKSISSPYVVLVASSS